MKDQQTNYGTEGMLIGMCFGCAIGASGVINLATAMMLGLLIGLAVGMNIKKLPEQ